MERLEIIEALKHLPDALAAELTDVSGEALRRKNGDEWSIIEVAGHLADYAPVQYKRLYMVWSLTDPVFPPYDQVAAVRDGNFQSANPADLIAKFRAARMQAVDLLAHAVDWSRLGNQPGVGRRTLKQFAERAVAHDSNHILQIRTLKAGSPRAATRTPVA